jgi:hypothetical protein
MGLQSTQAPHSNHFFEAHPDKMCQLAEDDRQATAARRYKAMIYVSSGWGFVRGEAHKTS